MFCKYCGNELFDEAVFCPKCHKSTLANHKIVVHREPFAVINSNKSVVAVEVDDELIGKLLDDETITVELPEGMHKVNIYYLWHSEKKRNQNIIRVNLFKDAKFEVNWNNFLGKLQVMEIQC